MNIGDWLGQNTVYVVITGSHAYGTSTPESDHDYRGAAIPPRIYHFGFENFEQAESKKGNNLVQLVGQGIKQEFPNDADMTIWSLHKMIELAADGNPNMIELVFSPEETILKSSKYVEKFFDIRTAFLSKLLKHRFSGYAMQQLKRIRNHYRWLHNPPDYPTREKYGIEGVKFPKDQLGAAERVIDLLVEEWLVDQTHLPEDIKIQLGPQMIRMVNIVCEQLQIETSIDRLRDVLDRAANRTLGFDSDFLNYLQRYKAYKNHLNDWNSYEKWKEERNPARAVLEAKWGYDTKHAMHLYRLLTMAREILEKHQVIVKRPDAEYLNEIRHGVMTYDEIVEWAEKEDKALDEVMNNSTLPKSPNRRLISDTLMEATEDFLYAAESIRTKIDGRVSTGS